MQLYKNIKEQTFNQTKVHNNKHKTHKQNVDDYDDDVYIEFYWHVHHGCCCPAATTFSVYLRQVARVWLFEMTPNRVIIWPNAEHINNQQHRNGQQIGCGRGR